MVYAAIILFAHDDMPSIYAKWSAAIDAPRPFDEAEINALLQDRVVSKIAFEQLYDTVHRAALKEMYEITKNYCETTGQIDILKAQSWYQFWRILRNCISHDFRFNFRDYDRKKLPVTWGAVTIDVSMEGKILTHGILSREQLLGFLSEVSNFVELNLA